MCDEKVSKNLLISLHYNFNISFLAFCYLFALEIWKKIYLFSNCDPRVQPLVQQVNHWLFFYFYLEQIHRHVSSVTRKVLEQFCSIIYAICTIASVKIINTNYISNRLMANSQSSKMTNKSGAMNIFKIIICNSDCSSCIVSHPLKLSKYFSEGENWL